MQLIKSYLRRYSRLLITSMVLATINQVFSLVNPQIFRILIDRYANQLDAYTESEFISGVVYRSLIAIAAALISRLAKTFQDYYVNLMSQTIGSKIYAQGVSHAFSLPYRVFEDRQSGSLLDKLLKARTDVQNLLNSMINTVFLTSIGMIIVLGYALRVHRLIGVIFIVMIPILGVTTWMISRNIKKSQTRIVAQSAALSGATVENIKNVTLIKSLGLESQEIDHLTTTNDKLIDLEIDKLKLIKTLSFTQGTLINLLRTILQ
jgi:ATP-binding cassette subfamily B protein